MLLQSLIVGSAITYFEVNLVIMALSRKMNKQDPIDWHKLEISRNQIPRLFYLGEDGLSYIASKSLLKQIQKNNKVIEQSLGCSVDFRIVKGLMFDVLVVCFME